MKALFVDRDGTLVEEPPDEQVDSLEKIRFLPGVFAALTELQSAGFCLAMVTNQDGLGTASFPTEDFERPQQFILDAFASQGIRFEAIFVCPHKPADGCDCRKPSTKLVDQWLRDNKVDPETTKITLGPKLTLAGKEEFSGARAAEANKFLTREYRAPYIVPRTEDL